MKGEQRVSVDTRPRETDADVRVAHLRAATTWDEGGHGG